MPELPPHSPLLDISDERRGDSLIVRVHGEIDLSTGPPLEQHLRGALESLRSPNPLVVDLSGVDFLGSSGLALLLHTHEAAQRRGTPLRIVAAQRAIRRPVEAVGLRTTLSLHPTVESALGSPG
ncbi:anti-anti-sigma factor [Prauserella marina]|uniref:Anti-sigma factor antagonist n=1 Tax=Prauserella marina TaxID=530584 RepID=A0A222VMA1_9PSEU|nr:STAS domain-containing protein [Prauserella marina]ASR34972.1 anti-anti-sigma factor [Prauserella marina]PWV85305.1 anti-anti-sigma factor [Prauserella marina]SDC00115.1 anti-anti-sigma factor [Prauserella marina]